MPWLKSTIKLLLVIAFGLGCFAAIVGSAVYGYKYYHNLFDYRGEKFNRVLWDLSYNYGIPRYDREELCQEYLSAKEKKGKYNENKVEELCEPLNKSRCKMVNDLKSSHLKKGMSFGDVENLLGYEDSVVYCLNKKVKMLSYYLGSCYDGFSFSYNEINLLNICFNSRNELMEFGIDKNCCSAENQNQSSAVCSKEKQSCRCPKKDTKGISYQDCQVEQW